MASAKTTTLQAVNKILLHLGQQPVAALQDTRDAYMAEQYLFTVDLEVQSRGWSWNREKDIEVTLDGSGHAVIPDAHVNVDPEDAYYIFRDDKLYDTDGKTYVLGSSGDTKKYSATILLPFDDIPEAARYYIFIRAARKMAQAQGLGGELIQALAIEEVQAYSDLERSESEQNPLTIFDHPDVGSIVDRNSLGPTFRR